MDEKTKILHKEGRKFQLFLFTQTRCSVIIIRMPEDGICSLSTIINGANDPITDISNAVIVNEG